MNKQEFQQKIKNMEPPKQINDIKEVSCLAGGMWNKLAELNEDEEE